MRVFATEIGLQPEELRKEEGTFLQRSWECELKEAETSTDGVAPALWSRLGVHPTEHPVTSP